MEILKNLEKYLTSKGFKPDENKKIFVLEKDFQAPGQQIIINGQAMQQPGPKVIRTVTVEFFGPGHIDHGDRQEPFEEILVRIKEQIPGMSDSRNVQEFVEGIYDSDFERVKLFFERTLQ